MTTGGEKVWDWLDVAVWLHDRLGLEVDIPPHELATADRLLAARAALDAEPDEQARATLAGLLHAS